MLSRLSIACVYATAIFEVAVEQNNVDQWKLVLGLFSKVSQNSLMRSFLYRCLAPKRLSDIFLTVCEDCYQNLIDVYHKNLIYVMAENNRLLLLPMVFKEFENLYSNYVCTIEIEVISAWPLQYTQLRGIADVMAKRLSKTVKAVNIIDKYILAGIIVRVGDTVIDGSIRGRIMRLNCALQS